MSYLPNNLATLLVNLTNKFPNYELATCISQVTPIIFIKIHLINSLNKEIMDLLFNITSYLLHAGDLETQEENIKIIMEVITLGSDHHRGSNFRMGRNKG